MTSTNRPQPCWLAAGRIEIEERGEGFASVFWCVTRRLRSPAADTGHSSRRRAGCAQ